MPGAEYRRQVVAAAQEALRRREDIAVEAILEEPTLEEHGTRRLVVLFRSARRPPECLFAFRFPAWPPGDTPAKQFEPAAWAAVLATILDEELDAVDRGLPSDPSRRAITWLT